MIRRVSKNNDLRDVIKSKPTAVVAYIYELRYYIFGKEDRYISPEIERSNDVLIATLSTQELQKLSNGILYRKAFYSVPDESYPDGSYNLEFEDNMNLWLGDVNTDEPSGEYLTADDLKTINGQSVVGIGDIKIGGVSPEQEELINQIPNKADKSEIPSLDGYATEEWVEGKGYLTEHQSLDGYATEEWVEGKGYLTEHQSLDGYATEEWVEGKGYLTEHQSLAGYATEEWVEGKGYLTEHQSLEGYATETWVESKGYLTEHQDISNLATKVEVEDVEAKIPDVSEYTKRMNVDFKSSGGDQMYVNSGQTFEEVLAAVNDGVLVTGSFNTMRFHLILASTGILNFCGFTSDKTGIFIKWQKSTNTITRTNVQYALKSDIPSLFGYATEDWVSQQGYTTIIDVETWVGQQGYVTWDGAHAWFASKNELGNYALKTEIPTIPSYVSAFINDKGYLTEHQDISGKVDKSSIWTGTQAQWDALTDAQKASYTIALITE